MHEKLFPESSVKNEQKSKKKSKKIEKMRFLRRRNKIFFLFFKIRNQLEKRIKMTYYTTL